MCFDNLLLIFSAASPVHRKAPAHIEGLLDAGVVAGHRGGDYGNRDVVGGQCGTRWTVEKHRIKERVLDLKWDSVWGGGRQGTTGSSRLEFKQSNTG